MTAKVDHDRLTRARVRRRQGRHAARQEAHQSRFARRRHARRLHLGRARSTAGGRAARRRGHFRHLGRRGQCRHAGGWLAPRRQRRSGQAPGGFLACNEPWRRPAALAARGDRQIVLAGADRHADARLVHRLVALPIALRRQPAQHQSAEGADRALRRFRRATRRSAPDLHRRHQRADRALTYFSAREDFRRIGDGLGLPARRVPGGRDRRRALLGRRLSRQSGDLPVLPRHRQRRRADRADQPAGAQEAADLDARDHVPRQRDHLQRAAVVGAARDRIRQPADRPGPAAARQGPERIPPHQRAPHRAGGPGRAFLLGQQAAQRLRNRSSCCASSASARRGGFSMRITPTSASAAAST